MLNYLDQRNKDPKLLCGRRMRICSWGRLRDFLNVFPIQDTSAIEA